MGGDFEREKREWVERGWRKKEEKSSNSQGGNNFREVGRANTSLKNRQSPLAPEHAKYERRVAIVF